MISIATSSSPAVPGQRSAHAVDSSRTARVYRTVASPLFLSSAARRRPSSSSSLFARFISVLSVAPCRSVKRNAILAVEPDYYRIQYVEGEPVGKRVKLFNLPPNLDEKEFIDWFASIDIPVQSLELTDDPDLNADGIDGFMEFHTDEDARNAIAKRDGQKFNGCCIRLDFVQKKPWADGRRTRPSSMSTPLQPPLFGAKVPSASSYGASVSSSPSSGGAPGAVTTTPFTLGTGSFYGTSLPVSQGSGVTGSNFGSVKPATSSRSDATGTGYGSSSTGSAPNYASGDNSSSSFASGQPVSSYGSHTTNSTQFSSSLSSNSQAAPSNSNDKYSSSQSVSVSSYGETPPASPTPTSRYGGNVPPSPRYEATQSVENFGSATQSTSRSQSSPRARNAPSARGNQSNSSYEISDAEIYDRLAFGRPDGYKPAGSPPKMGSFSPPPSYTNPVPSTPWRSTYDNSDAPASQSIPDTGPSYGNLSSKSETAPPGVLMEPPPSYVGSTYRSPDTPPSHSNSEMGPSSGNPSSKSGSGSTDVSTKSPPIYGGSTYGNSDALPSYSGTSPSYGNASSRSGSPSIDAATEPPPSFGRSVSAKSAAPPSYSTSEMGPSYGNPSSRSGSAPNYAFTEPPPYGRSSAPHSYSNSEAGSSYGGNLGLRSGRAPTSEPPPSYGSSSYRNSDAPSSYGISETGPSYGDPSSNFGRASTDAGTPRFGSSTYGNSDAFPSYGRSESRPSYASPSNGSPSYGSSRPFSSNQIFVGNLPWSADDYRLQELFSEFGTVLEARVVKDRESGRSRGFGFVSMSTAEEKQAAIDALNGKPLDGRPLRVNEASSRF